MPRRRTVYLSFLTRSFPELSREEGGREGGWVVGCLRSDDPRDPPDLIDAAALAESTLDAF